MVYWFGASAPKAIYVGPAPASCGPRGPGRPGSQEAALAVGALRLGAPVFPATMEIAER